MSITLSKQATAPVPVRSLDELAVDINDAHEKARRSTAEAVLQWARVGSLLLEARGVVKHGNWNTWVEKNLTFNDRQAWKYMRVADGLPELMSNLHSNGDLQISSIDDAVKLLAREPSTPRPKRRRVRYDVPEGVDPKLGRRALKTADVLTNATFVPKHDKRAAALEELGRSASALGPDICAEVVFAINQAVKRMEKMMEPFAANATGFDLKGGGR